MADSGTRSFQFSPAFNEQPTIIVGVTTQELCLILGARLRVLRRAGFRVVLVSGPGELLIAQPRSPAWNASRFPCAAVLLRWPILFRCSVSGGCLAGCRPDLVEFSTPKAGLLGTLAARLRGVPRRVYMLRGLKLERSRGFKRRILLATERMACASAHVVLCNSASLRAEALALRLASPEKLLVLGEGSSIGVDVERFSPGPSDVRDKIGIPREAASRRFCRPPYARQRLARAD